MSARCIIAFLDYKLKSEAQNVLFQSFVGESIASLTGGKVSYMEKYKEIWGLAKKEKEPTKSAEEVITETLKKHNIKIKRKSE